MSTRRERRVAHWIQLLSIRLPWLWGRLLHLILPSCSKSILPLSLTISSSSQKNVPLVIPPNSVPFLHARASSQKKQPWSCRYPSHPPTPHRIPLSITLVWTGNSDERKTTRLPARTGGRNYIQVNN
ncbi:hypothetical protein K470DRAFT_47188 [Piedraia hortae CBS 480.64]|uniref:Uncharacterized protein n=1 Tax=Piedraia hortae CBS 480.64 TaxID=1314780 RepID=A0A6A7C1N8_9PEZI|nr:hypothetical protein K470DRAFT_47188 [Piedraia hortae CBS 480.64]